MASAAVPAAVTSTSPVPINSTIAVRPFGSLWTTSSFLTSRRANAFKAVSAASQRRLRGRLPEKRQCAECAAALLVIHLRDDLDGNVSEARVALEPVKDQPAVTVRQSQIKRDRRWHVPASLSERRGGRRGGDDLEALLAGRDHQRPRASLRPRSTISNRSSPGWMSSRSSFNGFGVSRSPSSAIVAASRSAPTGPRAGPPPDRALGAAAGR